MCVEVIMEGTASKFNLAAAAAQMKVNLARLLASPRMCHTAKPQAGQKKQHELFANYYHLVDDTFSFLFSMPRCLELEK